VFVAAAKKIEHHLGHMQKPQLASRRCTPDGGKLCELLREPLWAERVLVDEDDAHEELVVEVVSILLLRRR
jgi:hypothetical protein